MLLVLGASHIIGRHVVHALHAMHTSVRVLGGEPGDASASDLGNADVVPGDSRNWRALQQALVGVDGVILITHAHPEQSAYEQHIVAALQHAGVNRLVKLSSAGAAADAPFAVGRWHWQTERLLAATRLDWTVVRSHRPMQHVYGQVGSVRGQHTLYGCQGDGATPDVDARDVASVLATVAASGTRVREVLHVTGPVAVTATECAEVLGRQMGEPVVYVDCASNDFVHALMAGGVSQWRAEDRAAWQCMVERDALSSCTNVVQEVTGRPARTYEAFAAEFAASIRYARCPAPRDAATAAAATGAQAYAAPT